MRLFLSGLCMAMTLVGCAQYQSESEISWKQALDLFERCEVESGWQLHDLRVGLTLKDGSQVVTREPRIDEILNMRERFPDCDYFPIATE